MSYGWIIDKDHIAEPHAKPGTNSNAVGIMGPRNIRQEYQDQLANGLGWHFRMYDDDGGLYYEGRLIGDKDSEDGFGPLDDFGTPNAGCTEIRYLNGTGHWETL